MDTNATGPISASLSDLLEGLLKAGVDFILVGSLAAVVQGAPITTMDADIVHSRTSENVSKLMAVLKSVDACYRRLDHKLLAPSEGDLSGDGCALLRTRLGPVDVLAVIEQGKSYEDFIEHTVGIEFRGHILRVLDLNTLIHLKEGSKDSRDKLRLLVLKETLRQLEGHGTANDDVNLS